MSGPIQGGMTPPPMPPAPPIALEQVTVVGQEVSHEVASAAHPLSSVPAEIVAVASADGSETAEEVGEVALTKTQKKNRSRRAKAKAEKAAAAALKKAAETVPTPIRRRNWGVTFTLGLYRSGYNILARCISFCWARLMRTDTTPVNQAAVSAGAVGTPIALTQTVEPLPKAGKAIVLPAVQGPQTTTAAGGAVRTPDEALKEKVKEQVEELGKSSRFRPIGSYLSFDPDDFRGFTNEDRADRNVFHATALFAQEATKLSSRELQDLAGGEKQLEAMQKNLKFIANKLEAAGVRTKEQFKHRQIALVHLDTLAEKLGKLKAEVRKKEIEARKTRLGNLGRRMSENAINTIESGVHFARQHPKMAAAVAVTSGIAFAYFFDLLPQIVTNGADRWVVTPMWNRGTSPFQRIGLTQYMPARETISSMGRYVFASSIKWSGKVLGGVGQAMQSLACTLDPATC